MKASERAGNLISLVKRRSHTTPIVDFIYINYLALAYQLCAEEMRPTLFFPFVILIGALRFHRQIDVFFPVKAWNFMTNITL